ncbi:hypothetical protein EXW55_30755 (plasmid) [Bacillus mycoides]|nr:hypothetical protein EXW55_30755 [Bacillus mycoides]
MKNRKGNCYGEYKDKKISKRQGRVRQIQRSSQQWDDLCKQAVVLYDQGMTYSFIAKQFDCSLETLRVKLKKTGLVGRFLY